MKVGVVGGGIVGCLSAHALAKQGVNVTLFEALPTLGSLSSRSNASLLAFDSTFSIYDMFPDKDSVRVAITIQPWWSTLHFSRYPFSSTIRSNLKAIGKESQEAFFDAIEDFPSLPYSDPCVFEGHPLTRIAHSKDWIDFISGNPSFELCLNEKVTGWERNDVGDRVDAIWTSERRFEADAFVLCTGPFPSTILPLPIAPFYGKCVIEDPIGDGTFGYLDGDQCVTQFLGMHKVTSGGILRESRDEARKDLDAKDDDFVEARPLTPDGLPLVDVSPTYSNLFFNVGHGFFGWTFSFWSARVISQMVLNGYKGDARVKLNRFFI